MGVWRSIPSIRKTAQFQRQVYPVTGEQISAYGGSNHDVLVVKCFRIQR